MRAFREPHVKREGKGRELPKSEERRRGEEGVWNAGSPLVEIGRESRRDSLSLSVAATAGEIPTAVNTG